MGRKRKDQMVQSNEVLDQMPQEKTKTEIMHDKAEAVLLHDPKIQQIAQLLRTAAEEGNPAARTLYGVYNMFIGSNLPEREDVAYAEAIKWFYMNRHGVLESRLLDELTGSNKNVYSSTEDIYRRACNMATITQSRPVEQLTAEQVAVLVSMPLEMFNVTDETLRSLRKFDDYTIGSLLLCSDYWQNQVKDERDRELLNNIISHLRSFVPRDQQVALYIRRYNEMQSHRIKNPKNDVRSIEDMLGA